MCLHSKYPSTMLYDGEDVTLDYRGKRKSVHMNMRWKKSREQMDAHIVSCMLDWFKQFTQDILTASANPPQNDDKDIEVEALTFYE